MVHAIHMTDQYTADSSRFLILSTIAPYIHVILFWILFITQKVTRFTFKTENKLAKSCFTCEDFVWDILSDLCDVNLCVFTAILLSQLALLIFHFVFKPISRRALIASAISTSGASLMFTIASQIIFCKIHTTLSLTVTSCHSAINLYFIILAMLKMMDCVLITMRISKCSLLRKMFAVCSLILIALLTLTMTSLESHADMLHRVKKATGYDASIEEDTAPPDSHSLVPFRRASEDINISVIIVYKEGTPLENYSKALNSVECYSKLHSYPFHLFSDAKYMECAKHKDLFFRRHCVIVNFMQIEMKEGTWLLVLDGDIAVSNPMILIDDFVNNDYDITLFDRFFNFEVGANSYLVRNTKLGQEFVQKFAEYEFKLPKSFHGTDNGALHPYLAELLVPDNSRPIDALCAKVWQQSKNYGNLYEMEACTRLIFGDRTHFPEKKLRILPKGKGWVRDLWLLKSHWAESDFMLHAVKEKALLTLRPEIKNISDSQLFQWNPNEKTKRAFPLLQKLNITKCALAEEKWVYDTRLKISNERKTKLLDEMEKKVLKKRLEAIGRLSKRL